MLNFFIIISLIFFILTLRLSFKVNFYYDVYKNKGAIILKLFFVPILAYDLELKRGYVNLLKKEKKMKIEFNLKDKNIIFLNNMRIYLLNNVYLNDLEIKVNYSNFDVSKVSLLNSIFMQIETYIYTFLKYKSIESKIKFEDNYSFLNMKFLLSFNINIIVSLLDFILALLKSKFQGRLLNAK